MGDPTTFEFGHLRCEQCDRPLSLTGWIVPSIIAVDPSGPADAVREGVYVRCAYCGQLRVVWPEVRK